MYQDTPYYKIPFNPTALFQEDGGAIEMCSLAESIAQNIMLLITTRQGENRYNSSYGNAVWNIEFDNAATSVLWEETFTGSLMEQIAQHEPRIMAAKIQVRTAFVEHTYKTKKFSEIKRKATVVINATLTETGEPFNFSTEIFLSPMSVD